MDAFMKLIPISIKKQVDFTTKKEFYPGSPSEPLSKLTSPLKAS